MPTFHRLIRTKTKLDCEESEFHRTVRALMICSGLPFSIRYKRHLFDAILIQDFLHETEKIFIKFAENVCYFQQFRLNVK